MFASHRAEACALRTGLLQPVLAVVLAALLGACSSSRHPAGPQVFAWLQTQPTTLAPTDPMDVEIDDDGLPTGTAPSAGMREMPNDPSTPWIANDGRNASRVGHDAAARSAGGAVPGDEGLPLPKSPEEAGIAPEQNPVQKQKRAYLTLPLGLCTGWKCSP